MTLWIACAAVTAVVAAPDGIDLIEQVHTVQGSAGYPLTETYFVSGTGAVTGSASGLGPDGLLCTATSAAGPGSLSAYRNGSAGWANAYAQSTYRFQPDRGHLVLDVSGVIGEWAFENLASLQLTDETAGAIVYSFESPHEPYIDLYPDAFAGYAFGFHHDLPVNPAHVYELVGAVEAHRGEPGSGSATMSLGFSAVPAPMPLALGALGAACVAWLRRRRLL